MLFKNFGQNVVYEPTHYYEPKTEQEVLDILEKHKTGHIRVRSTGHSWSDIVAADDALVRMNNFIHVIVEERESGPVARIGAGAVLQNILDYLHTNSPYTFPTLGGIKKQTIAGATATATHGTGAASLSSYVRAVKIAYYDTEGKPQIKTIDGGEELLAARASLGCLGIVLEITIEVVPKFWMKEVMREHQNLDSILAEESVWPQQSFFLLPYSWKWYAYHRARTEQPEEQALRRTRWYKIYDFIVTEIGLHTMIKVVEWKALLFGKKVITMFWTRVLPPLMRPNTVVGDSETILTLHTEHHDTFRHVEMELFIPPAELRAMTNLLQKAIPFFAGIENTVDEELSTQLTRVGLLEGFKKLHGKHVCNYVFFFRHVLTEDTLMATNEGGERYSLSILTFEPPHKQEGYRAVCDFLALAALRLFSARLHLGKYNPLSHQELAPLYPHMEKFKAIARRHDPNGVFQNDYTKRVLGM